VHGNDGLREAHCQADKLVTDQRAMGIHVVGQVPTFDVLGHQVGVIRVQVGVEVLGGADATYTLSSLNLSTEAGPERRVVRKLGPDQFERHLSTTWTFSQVDHTHPACSDPSNESVGTDILRIVRTEVLHRRPSLRRAPDQTQGYDPFMDLTLVAGAGHLLLLHDDNDAKDHKQPAGEEPRPPGRGKHGAERVTLAVPPVSNHDESAGVTICPMRFRVMLVAGLASTLCLTVVLPAGATTKAQLRSKLLSLSNFPTGWTVDNSSSGGGSVVNGGCLAGVKQAPKSETKVSAAFENGQLPELQEELVTGHGASAAYNRLNRVLAGCKHFTASSDGQTLTLTVGAMSFPSVGSESSAYGVTMEIKGINAGADFVLFRIGSIGGLIEYANIGQPDPSQLQGFVAEAVNKIEGKPTVTPTTF
jgi:hypothetical protein